MNLNDCFNWWFFKQKSTDIDETNKEDDEERDERDSEIDEDDDNNDVLKSIDTTGFQPGRKWT